MNAPYNPRFDVVAAWSLEFLPVNVSVVFMQRDDNEHVCIGSKSWPFELLATCIAEVRTLFPWRVATHVLPPDGDPPIWQQAFSDQHIQRVEQLYPVSDQARIVLTQRLIPRMRVDTAPRAWEPQGNNTLLLDSLNGYSMTESARPETFTLHIAPTFEQYLTRAVENYAVWLEFFGSKPDELDWSERRKMRTYA